ncbi:glycosyltransferase family 2 protein [Arthrobacter sp. YAF16]|jgi:glycosyltransferase involved in cell wall biosynthesis|uniref:glycosyltransferase family 2 protein n=1 Tax=Arthrobacter sp. YAF16 TaxID=3233076 RepID=UPI003F91BA9E
MTTISVVIPTRNDAQMLAACLAALGRQSRRADEVIVVDNGSTDNTAAVCTAAGARRIVVDLPGIAAATARGFDEADSEIIARLDADSVPPADWLERVEAILDKAGPLTAVSGPGNFYGGTRFARWVGRNIWIAGYFWAIGLLLGHPPLFGSNFALRADVWEKIRGTVHRGRPPVHDDLDISYQIPPEVSVLWEPALRVGVSARPFESRHAVGRRLSMAWTTFGVEFRSERPLRRRRRRKRWERAHRR